ncbi:uncharacterized protein JCM15063_001436 [Sporobolomyces koalae]|uniref:uncharacterized protein n=1 Tax=Sporobolomyces koalae TaxID=500713 RepID=UPI00317BB023
MAKSTTKNSKVKVTKAPRASSPASSRSGQDNSSESDNDSDSASSSSSSGRSSASPEPVPVPKARRVDPHTQKYSPPAGFKLAKDTTTQSAIDWDTINNNPDLQLWAVRVPAGLKAKHLDKLTIQLPSSAESTSATPVATFTASKSDYHAYLSPANKRKHGQPSELDNVLPLLPKKSAQNKLFQAPRPISQTLTIRRALPSALASLPSAASFSHSTLIASQPSPVPGAILSAPELLDPVAIASKKTTRSQPAGLKFRLELSGMGQQGGQGQYHNGVVLEPRENLLVSSVDDATGEGGEEDQEMATTDDVTQGLEQQEEAEIRRKKEEKKAKKDKKRKEQEQGETPKKKKVKAEQ